MLAPAAVTVKTSRRWPTSGRPRGCYTPPRNVSHDAGSPLSNPALNQRMRCALLPCVKLSGSTSPRDCFCSRSSPTADAAPSP